MEVKNILDILIEEKVQIRLSDDKNLKLSSQNGKIGTKVISLIKENKPAILAYLEARQEQSNKAAVQIARAPKMDYYPVSADQYRMWVLSQFEEASVAYNISNGVIIKGDIDIATLKEANKRLFVDNEILRTTFFQNEKGQLLQEIHDVSKVSTNVIYQDVSNATDGLTEAKNSIKANCQIPMEFTTGPMYKLFCFKISEDSFFIAMIIHHIISDGWSLQILNAELLQNYDDIKNGIQTQNTPEKFGYKDFAYWQNEQLKRSKSKSLDFWKEKLAGELPVLNLVNPTQRPNVKTYVGKYIENDFTPELSKNLKTFFGKQQSTMFIGMMAAVNVLLNKYSGDKDIIVGTPVAGREIEEFRNTVGLFANSVPIRLQVDTQMSFLDFLGNTRKEVVEAFDHQNFPFEQMVELVDEKRDISRAAIFDVLVVMQNMDFTPDAVPNSQPKETNVLSVETVDIDSKVSLFDLTWTFTEKENGIGLLLRYNTDLFDETYVNNLINHFVNLLEEIAENPNKSIASLNILSKEERSKILELSSNKGEDVANTHIWKQIEKNILNNSANTAFVFEDKHYSFKELDEHTKRLAVYLKEKYELTTSDRLVLQLPKNDALLLSILACIRIGVTYMPIPENSPEKRVHFILEDSQAKGLVNTTALEDFENYKAEHTFIQEELDPTQALYGIYTSGSTGTPKAVIVSSIAVNNFLEGLEKDVYPQKNNGLKVAQMASFSFDASVQQFLYSLTRGCELHIISDDVKSNIPDLWEYIIERKIQVTDGTHSLYLEMSKNFPENIQENVLERIILGGESFKTTTASTLFSTIKQAANFEIVNVYGPTECTVNATFYKVTSEEDIPENAIDLPIGKPSLNYGVYILDENKEPLPIGFEGDLYISGPSLAIGYLNREKLTNESFTNALGIRMYRTGDLAKWDANGLLHFIGRKDNQVKIRGYRIELGEIESKLLEYDGVTQAVVIAKDMESGDKELLAFIKVNTIIDNNEVRNFLKGELTDYMLPSSITQVDNFEMNSSGKLNTKALLSLDVHHTTNEQVYLPPINAEQEAIQSIWHEVLGHEPIGIDIDFFAVGGNSLKAMRLISEYHKKFNSKLALKDIFEHNTIEKHQQLMINSSEDQYAEIPKIGTQENYILSDAQRRIWVLSQFQEGLVAYNMPSFIELEGKYDTNILLQSIHAVVEKHEILRTVFKPNENDEIRQWILPAYDVDIPISVENVAHIDNSYNHISAYIKEDSFKPFDIENGPLLRGKIFCIADDQFLIYFNMHHLVGDAWSNEVLKKEILKIYNTLIANEALSTESLRIQYKDYAAWQSNQLKSGNWDIHKKYWLNELKGELPLIDLPSEKVRPSIKTYNGNSLQLVFNTEEAARLNEFSKKYQGSLFSTLLSVFHILIHRYSGQKDQIIGVPIAGRSHADLEDQIGVFINMLSIRNEIKTDLSFVEFYKNVTENLLEAYQNQVYPFDRLVEELDIPRDTSRSPIFDISISLQNVSLGANPTEEDYHFNTEVDDVLVLGAHKSKNDLEVAFEETNEEIICNVIYNTNVYEEEMITQFMKHYRLLASVLTSDPSIQLSAAEFLNSKDKSTLLDKFNDTEYDLNEDETTISLFKNILVEKGSELAVLYEGEELTYEELDTLSNQFAYYLKAEFHITEGDVVGVMLPRSQWLLVTILGIMKTGAIYLPISLEYPQKRTDYILEDSGCKACINQAHLHTFTENLAKYGKSEVAYEVTANQLAYIIYTSGTTGQPKGVMIEHKSLVNFIMAMRNSLDLDASDHLLALTSTSFDISILELLYTVCSGILVTVASSNTDFSIFDTYLQQHKNKTTDFSVFFFSSQKVDQNNKYDLLLKTVKYADQNDFSAVWLPERHFHEFGGIFPAPSVVGASLATITNTINIRSGSVVLPLHDTIRVAEEWSVVDNLSNGRVSLSIASGWTPNDFVLRPDDFSNRKVKMFQQIAELRKLWKGETIKRINGVGEEIDVEVFPKPIQKEIPIWVTTGGNPETYAEAGKIGANILTHLLGQTLDQLQENIKVYKKALSENGHSVKDAKISLMLHTYIGEDIDEVKELVREPFKSYLKSSLGLIGNMLKEFRDGENTNLHEDDLNNLVDLAFERYWQDSALIGTQESVANMLQKIQLIGVNEIACLVDFGLDKDVVVNGLEQLNEVRKKNKSFKANDTKPTRPITAIQTTPSFLKILKSEEHSIDFLKSLKHIIIGGEALSDNLKNEVKELTNAEIYNMYGPTETTIWSVMEKMSESPVVLGKPIANTQIYVLNEDLNVCPIGVAGEIYIGGKGVARGYINKESLTKEKFIPSPFDPNKKERLYKTGDLAKWNANGTLVFLGRKDFQVKVRGHRIELSAIEKTLTDFQGIEEAVVIINELNGEKEIAAFYTGNERIAIVDLRNYIAEILPNYMTPSYFIYLNEFPLNFNGKIDKKALLNFKEEQTLSTTNYVAPNTEAEKALAEIWKTILDTEKIGIHDDFFELGGHSLKALKLLSEIRKTFNVNLSLEKIFNETTINKLALYIEAMKLDTHVESSEEDGELIF
ncbi:non-ribosomal peptide synthetase [uncultured Kordia sp.]|uniref:non-ribosomal peptide synthetase n=1 Tax=uncultured Kordia sp. TaxID=507699 RepID=UPI00262FB11C|nr:non-ribosomal peptide synthetase [uncultured Kordia sp.]